MPPGGTPIVVPLIGDLKPLKRSLKGGKKLLLGFGIAAAAAFAGVAASSIGEYAKLDKGVREVATLVGDATDAQIKALQSDVREIATAYGQTGTEVAKAFYDSLSAGVASPENVKNFAGVAAKFAAAGATEIGAGVDLLSSALNAFQLETSEANRVSDVFFGTVKAGKTTVDEIAASFSDIGPTAAAAGVSIEDVSAWLAQLTLSGTPTTQATTQIKAALADLSREGTVLSNNFEEIAGKTFRTFIAEGGSLEQAMVLIQQQADASGKSMFEMSSNLRATQGLLGVTGENAKRFSETLVLVKDSAGATDIAFGVMNASLDMQMRKFKAAIVDIQYTIGAALLPVVIPTLERLAVALPNMVEAVGTSIGFVTNQVRNFVVPFVGMVDWSLKLADAVVWLYEKVEIFQQIVDGARAFLQDTMLPFFMDNVVPALHNVAATVVEYLVAAFDKAWAFLSEYVLPIFREVYGFLVEKLVIGFKVVADFITSTFLPAVSEVASTFTEGLLSAYKSVSDYMAGELGASVDTTSGRFSGLWESVSAVASALGGKLWEAISAIVGVVGDYLAPIWADFKDFLENDLWPAIRDIWQVIVEQWVPALIQVAEFIQSVLEPVIRNVLIPVLEFVYTLFFDVLAGAIHGFIDVLRGLVNIIAGVITGDWERAWGGIQSVFEGVFEVLWALPSALLDRLISFVPQIVAWGASLGTQLIDAIVNAIKGAAGRVTGAVKDAVTGAVSSVPGAGAITGAVGSIFGFAEGGIVTRPTLGLVGEAGPEAVIPLGALNSMRPVVFNNYFDIHDTLDSPASIGARAEEMLTAWASHKGGLDFLDAS